MWAQPQLAALPACTPKQPLQSQCWSDTSKHLRRAACLARDQKSTPFPPHTVNAWAHSGSCCRQAACSTTCVCHARQASGGLYPACIYEQLPWQLACRQCYSQANKAVHHYLNSNPDLKPNIQPYKVLPTSPHHLQHHLRVDCKTGCRWHVCCNMHAYPATASCPARLNTQAAALLLVCAAFYTCKHTLPCLTHMRSTCLKSTPCLITS